jgi:hypothetical protein
MIHLHDHAIIGLGNVISEIIHRTAPYPIGSAYGIAHKKQALHLGKGHKKTALKARLSIRFGVDYANAALA